jgi:O-methyltransferase
MLKLISRLTFLHTFYSNILNLIPSFLIHNSSKYMAIKKVITNLKIDQIDGDYIEFGIFTGSSFKHTIKTENKLNKNNRTMFYGLDSFEGFPENTHPYFQDKNFQTDYLKVKKIEKKFNGKAIIVKGYFKDSLKENGSLLNIRKIKFALIDCDLYISSIEPMRYLKSRLVKGSYLMIDDFTNIDKDGNSIKKIFDEVFQDKDYIVTNYFGIDGVVIRILN